MGISLEKLEKSAPQLVSLAKAASVSLEKANMSSHTARVALVLDISGSMDSLYRSGKVQRLAEKILALGTRFDDDGAIDVFLFGHGAYSVGEMNLSNFGSFVSTITRKHPLEGDTRYGEVMRIVREHYYPGSTGSSVQVAAPKQGFLSKLFGGGQQSTTSTTTATAPTLPAYVMFVTDGANSDRSAAEQQLVAASHQGMFWQFMAIGSSRSSFPFLEKLDDLQGRFIDNANFFNIADPLSISDSDLFDCLMSEYPGWVKLAQSKGLIV